MIAAGIVTYNPDVERLLENISAILPQVQEVVVFDNASENKNVFLPRIGESCTVLKNVEGQNIGIAGGLNRLCEYCLSKGYDWVLTLDQDSVCPPNLISAYEPHLGLPRLGMLCPRINDRNIGDIDGNTEDELSEVDSCITSASLLNLSAWKTVGGFQESLFIDMVDFDMCWTLQENGYRIVRVNSVSLIHELGHSTVGVVRGKQVAVFHHSAQRYYYIFRNTIVVGRKHHRRYQCLRWNLKRLYLILRYEENRGRKILKIISGVFDGIIGI